jgi:DNA invertase Pin-like site-specific DNA recombinase
MDAWWKEREPAAAPDPEKRAVAYYRHSAQDRQENSIPLQRDQVRRWAAEREITILQEFADHGKSGLLAEHRDAFLDMLENWVKAREDFKYVLVLDVSRWGRFQDVDLSATYSAECTRHGKKVVYTTLGLPENDDPLHAVLVGFERYRAAAYSRELSDKVFRGCARVAEQGYRAGGTAPYGLVRLLLGEDRLPVQELKFSERKAIHNQRVTLAPGNPNEVAVVRRIFGECAFQELQPDRIAEGLRRDGIPSPGRLEWTTTMVRDVLTNELYMGTMVYNKTFRRLKGGCKQNPREKWIRTRSAFPGIVTRRVFERAQEVLFEPRRRGLATYQLEQLRGIYERCGTLKYSLVEGAVQSVSVHSCQKNFRTLGAAFQEIFPELRESAARTVREELENLAGPVEEHEDFLVLGRRLTVLVQPAVPVPYGYRMYWPLLPDRRSVIDLTLGVLLSAPPEGKILGYIAFPRLLVAPQPIRLFPDDWRLPVFGHRNLGFISKLLSNGGACGTPEPAPHEGPAV